MDPDPDPGGPKAYGFYGFGSATLLLYRTYSGQYGTVSTSVADLGCLSRIRPFPIPDPNCLHPGSGCWLSTHPGSRIQGSKDTGFRIRIRNTGIYIDNRTKQISFRQYLPKKPAKFGILYKEWTVETYSPLLLRFLLCHKINLSTSDQQEKKGNNFYCWKSLPLLILIKIK